MFIERVRDVTLKRIKFTASYMFFFFDCIDWRVLGVWRESLFVCLFFFPEVHPAGMSVCMGCD